MATPGGKRLVNSKSGLKILCQHDKDASPWELAEPQWILDTEVFFIFFVKNENRITLMIIIEFLISTR